MNESLLSSMDRIITIDESFLEDMDQWIFMAFKLWRVTWYTEFI